MLTLVCKDFPFDIYASVSELTGLAKHDKASFAAIKAAFNTCFLFCGAPRPLLSSPPPPPSRFLHLRRGISPQRRRRRRARPFRMGLHIRCEPDGRANLVALLSRQLTLQLPPPPPY
jgi:hypothetical protein